MFQAIFDAVTDVFRGLLEKIPLHPSHYHGLFPKLNLEELSTLYEQGTIPGLSELAPSLTYCLILSIARYILQHFVVKYLALWCMQLKVPKFTPNPKIDNLLPYVTKAVYEPAKIESTASQSKLTVKEVEKYIIKRAHFKVVQKKIVKFVEAFWRCGFYAAFTYLGYRTLFTPGTVSWILDTDNYFKDWPHHPLLSSILLYYNIELGCYFHQLLWTEINHSDALEMMIHHFVTIALIIISHLTNFHRFGTTILFIHDISDVFLEGAKVLNYTAKGPSHTWVKPFVDIVFGIFAVSFFVTRLVIYPYHILGTVYTTGWEVFGWTFFGAYVYTFLLFALQILHIFWFYLISSMIYRLVTTGIDGDVRSDDEEEVEDNEEDEDTHKKETEGKKKK